MTFNIRYGNIFSETRTALRRGGMLVLIIVMVLAYWGCGSSNDSETSRITEGNESGFRMAIQMPAGSDPSDIERFEISVTGPGIPLFDSIGREIRIQDPPWSVALGDVDGKNGLDIVTANADSDDVSILLHNEDGTFADAQVFPVGDEPQSVALDDVDGDGSLDIVTANRSSDDVSILFGDGDGSFAEAQVCPVGLGPTSVALGHVNGDDMFLDIVTANRTSDTVSILLRNGNGSFSNTPRIPVGQSPQSVALDDVDKDDVLDIVTANGNSNDVSILFGDGNGSFAEAEASPFSVGRDPESVALGDVDGDGRVDIVTANRSSDDVSILFGDENGSSFATTQRFVVGNFPFSVALDDVDGDGVLDIVTANTGSDDVSILLGLGQGTFFSDQRFSVGEGPSSVALVDVDGDSFLDIIVANSNEDSVSILRSATSLKNIEPTPQYERVTIDGRDQLVFYLTLPKGVEVPPGRNRTFTVRAFLPNPLCGSTTQTISSSSPPVVVELDADSCSE